jgi:pimeloyl-ACP methyl ester carboxylesterase
MARFVLVHGAFAGAWIWGPLAEKLKAAGHAVEALDLPGSGADDTPMTGVTLESCAGRVAETLQKSSQPALLVGNSMGGLIATQAATQCPDRVAALVYVAAFAPHDGQSLVAMTQLPEGAGDQVQANIVVEGNPPVATMPDAAARGALYGCCAGDVAKWAISQHRPQAVAPFATPVSLPAGVLDGIPRYYVMSLRDNAIPLPLQQRMSRENACVEVVELDTDHTPQLSMTDRLAEVLDRFASQLTRSAHS